MTTPPDQSWPPSRHSAPTIQVGGPQGITIHGDRVQMGNTVIHPGTQAAPRQAPAQVAHAPSSRGHSLEMELFRHPRRLPQLMLASGVLLGLVAIITAIPAMGLPILVSIMASVFAVLDLSAAFVLLQIARRREADRALPPQLELGLLELAHQSGGDLCVPETARALKIPLDQAQEALERLAKRGHAELEVKEGGELVYKISQGAHASPNALPESARIS